jgi:FAD binding domain
MSMSNIAYSTDYIVETASLTYCKIGIDNTQFVDSTYTKPKEELVFVQAGVRLEELHLALQKANLALPHTCFPNGMHFVGATLTGSHGSKIKLGGMDDYVRAIHIVTDTGHYLLQRESNKVVTEAYASYLGNATLVSNDKLFNAAVISFGAFGIVHGMLLAVEPMYRMEMEVKKYDYDDVKDVFSSLDMTKLGLKSNELPYHIMFSVNAYLPNAKGVTVQTYNKIESTDARFATSSLQVSNSGNFNDKKTRMLTISLLRILRLPKRLLFAMVIRAGLNSALSTSMNGDIHTPYNAHSFDGATTRDPPFYIGRYIEIEVFVSSDDATRVIELYRKTLNINPIFTFIGLRYFSSSEATLAMGRFKPYTAAIATFSYETFPGTLNGFQRIFDALEASGISYAYHWGKRYPIQKKWIAAQYGDNLVEWLEQRDEFLSPEGKEMFSNQQLTNMGLHVPSI